METDNDVLNKAIDAICAIVGDAHKIAVKGGVNNKKVVIDDVVFTALVEDEITQTKKGLVVNRVNNIRHDSNDPILVITKYIPAEVAKDLKQMKINYLDVSGNAYLLHKNFFIYIKGEKLVKPQNVNQTRAFQEAGLKMIFAFLVEPENVNKPYRSIAELTGVSLASVGYVMKELQMLNFVLETKKKRILKNKLELLNRWIVAYHDVLRPRLVKKRMKFARIEKNNQWRNLPLNEIDDLTLWGGEPAAALVTEYLTPAQYTIYTNSSWQHLAKELRLIHDNNGDVEVLGFFWSIEENYKEMPIVPYLLVYADLIGSGNERNIETAKRIFDEKLQYIK